MKKLFKILIIAIICLSFIFILIKCGNKGDAPFYGIEYASSYKKVESTMGKPDDVEDNGLQNFNYYYENISFLGQSGELRIHFELSKVDSMYYVYESFYEYDFEAYVEKVVSYYTKEHGDPASTYNGSEKSMYYWELEDWDLSVETYLGRTSTFVSTPNKLYIQLYH